MKKKLTAVISLDALPAEAVISGKAIKVVASTWQQVEPDSEETAMEFSNEKVMDVRDRLKRKRGITRVEITAVRW